MIYESPADKADTSFNDSTLEGFAEFVGVGTSFIDEARKQNLGVAIYINTDTPTTAFAEKVPSEITVDWNGKLHHVPTIIIPVGDIKPH